MTTSDITLPRRRGGDARIIGAVGAAHFVSHYYILILPPLFDIVRGDYGVSYTKLGLAITVFNVVSALLQTPAGFLVDRIGARAPLIGGLLLGAAAFAVVGLVHSFWTLIVMFAIAGLANTVYHPADYAILSHRIAPERIGHAYSIHTFAGMFGSAAAPATLVFMESLWGWRGAFLASAVLGFAVALWLILQWDEPAASASAAKSAPKGSDATPRTWQLLTSAPILLNLLFFVLIALVSGGMQNFFIVSLTASWGTSPGAANAALTAYLLFSALGVLAGGVLAMRTGRHALVAAVGLIVGAVGALLIGVIDLGTVALMAVVIVSGWFAGIIMPSRDMIVRAVTPPGSFGTVFGFVTVGFNIGGIIAPLIFGAMLDHGAPHWVFLSTALFSLLAVGTVGAVRRPERG
ncbi:MAG TPA: MFS transporter [Pseudolabrys sp.]|nr:MFS transporter [Pseudolabrys sp.]